MTTKEKLLTLFEKNKGVYFSGARRCLPAPRTLSFRGKKAAAAQRRRRCRASDRNQCLVLARKRFPPEELKNIAGAVLPAAASSNAMRRRQKPPGRRVSQLFYGAVPVFGGQLLYTGIPGTQFPYREGNPCPSSGRNKKSFCPGCRWGMPADRPV